MIRITLRILLVLLASAVVLVLVVLVALRVGAATWAVNRVLAAVKLPPGLTISAGHVKSNGLTWLEARDVTLSLSHGRATVSVEGVQGRYDALSLLSDRIVVHDLKLVRPRLVIQRRADTLRPPPEPRPRKTASSGSKPRVISIRSARIADGAFVLRFGAGAPDSITASFEAEGSLEASRLHLSRLKVRSNQSSLSGSGAVPLSSKSQFDLAVTAEPLGWSDLKFLSSHFDRDGQARATIHAGGTFRKLDLNLDADIFGGGAVHARGVVTTSSTPPLEYRLRSEIRGVDRTLLVASDRLPPRIDGEAMLDLSGSSRNRLDGKVEVSLRASPSSIPDARRVVARARFDEGQARINLDGNVGIGAVTIRGWLRPFDSIPSYDLKARAPHLAPGSSPWLSRLLGHQRGLAVSVAGSGIKPRQADLRALAVIDRRSGEAGLLDSGTAEIRLSDGAASIRSVVGLTGGTVAASGSMTLDPEIELRVDRGVVKAVDLAALIGDSSSSSLDARFNLRSRGASPRLARAELTLVGVDLSYGSHELGKGSFQLRTDSGNVRVTGRAYLDGGSLEAAALARPFEANPLLSLTNLRFQRLDLGRLVPHAGVSGEISGAARGQVRGRGLENLELSNVLTLEQSQIGKQSLSHARIEAHLAKRRMAIKAEVNGAAGRLSLTGFGLPFDSVPRYVLEDVDFQGLDLGQLLSIDRLRTSLTGSLRADASGHKPDDVHATGRLSLSTSTINDAAISDGRVDAELNAGELSLSGMLRAEDDSITLNATAHPFEKRPRGRLTSEVGLKALAPFLGRDSLTGSGTAGIRLEGDWDSPESQSLNGRLFARGSIADVKVDSLEVNLRMTNGRLTLDTLALSSNVGTMGGSGTVALFDRAAGSSGLQLTGQLADLAPLAPLLGVPPMDIDSGGFTATVRGPADSLSLDLAAQGGNLSVGPRRVGDFQATFSGELAGNSLGRGTADVQLERLVLGGTRLRKLGLEGTKEGNNLLVRVESVVDQERSARLVTRIEPKRSRIELDTLNLVVSEARWALAHPVRISYGDRIQVEDFLLASGGRRIAIDGVVDRRGEQQLTATIDSLELGRFVDLLGAPELDGQLNGSFTLTGHAANPHAVGAVDVVLHAEEKRVVGARGELDWSESGLQLNVGVDQSDGDSLKVSGRIPLALSLEAGDTTGVVSRIDGGTLALDAVTDRFRIEALSPLFDPETIKNLQGTLRMNAHATGTLEAPQLRGDVAVADAKVQIPRLGATYEKGQVHLRLQKQEVELTRARMESGGGRLETQGSIRLETLPEAAFDLQTTLSKFKVADAEDFRSSLSGKLNLVGTTGAPILTGSLQVSSTDVYLQAKNLQQSAEAVELTPEDQRILERRFGYQEASRSQTRKPLAPWKIDLGIQLKENNWLRRRSDPVMVVELGGKLDVRKAPGEDLTFFGEIQPLPGRSFVQVLGRRFDLKEGSVRLNGPLNQTAVAVDAEYRAATPTGAPPVLITTAIRADTGTLALTLSSIPAMRSEDIMSYLTTGRPADASPSMESDEQDVLTSGASLAVGAALGTVAGQAGQKVGLDVIQVLQDREGGQTLVAGKYVSPPLYLGVRTPIVPPPSPGRSETERDVAEFEVEYATLRQLLINLQGAGSELRVFLRLRR